MIASIQGVLESIENGAAYVWVPGGAVAADHRACDQRCGLTYEVMLTAYSAARLGGSIGESIVLRTQDYLESQGQGATMIPRLAGFTCIEDRQFFELFTTCKGIGNRKALRAMTMSTRQIAAAIVDHDSAVLQSLPEIGKRTAETVIATLRGKVDRFLEGPASSGRVGAAIGDQVDHAEPVIVREALKFLLELGENRAAATGWIDQALVADEPPSDVQSLLARVYRIKSHG